MAHTDRRGLVCEIARRHRATGYYRSAVAPTIYLLCEACAEAMIPQPTMIETVEVYSLRGRLRTQLDQAHRLQRQYPEQGQYRVGVADGLRVALFELQKGP